VRGKRAWLSRSPLTLVLVPLTLLGLTACQGTLPPLRGKIAPGRDPFAIFVGGEGVRADLYAVSADGGPAFPITFTPVAEVEPSLAPSGTEVAFLRGMSLKDSTPATIWLMNLVTGSERELELPDDSGRPLRLGWTPDGEFLVVETGAGLYRFEAPPEGEDPVPVPQEERAVAESSLAVLVGDPVFAHVLPCKRPTDLCVLTRKGSTGILAQAARDPVRWGPDSVAFFVGGDLLQIRPLARGRPRVLHWSSVPLKPRQMTFFPGNGDGDGES
jgi:hypothetical protein